LKYLNYFFEGESEDGNFLIRDRVEESVDNLPGKPGLLVVVHLDHALPITGRLHQVVPLANVNLN